jgi:hypothetical protein
MMTERDSGNSIIRKTWFLVIPMPLPASLIFSSTSTMPVYVALVVAIGIVAIGSFIGAPTLGDIIIRGTNSTDGTTFISNRFSKNLKPKSIKMAINAIGIAPARMKVVPSVLLH